MALEPDAGTPPGFFQSLLDRRVPQIAGLYFGIVWTAFEVVGWLINRFVLSPYLEDLFLMIALLAAPSVFMVGYGHGARGKNRWTLTEKIFIPANALAALVLLFLMFGGKDLGSAQQTVTLVDTEGHESERVIPKSEFRKRLALFFFDNETGDAAMDWTRSGIVDAFYGDLAQDLFITLRPAADFRERMQKVGFADGFGLPLALRQEIARAHRLDYVLGGALKQSDAGLTLVTRLYRTKSGDLIAERTFEGANLLPLIDAATKQLKQDMEVPKQHLEDTEDLPVAELLTASPTALRAYAEAQYAWTFKNDYDEADALLEQAVAEDPTFAFAHKLKGRLLELRRVFEPAEASYRQAQLHSYRIPERLRFELNTRVFLFERKSEEALQTMVQWYTLFPDDPDAVRLLARLKTLRGAHDEAVALLQQLVALEPSDPSYILLLGNRQRWVHRYDDALKTFQTYAERFPDQADGHQRQGWIYSAQGKLEQALEAYRQANVVAPNNAYILLDIAEVHDRLGHTEEAAQHYERALAQSRTPSEKAAAYHRMAYHHYLVRGQIEAFIDALETRWTHMAVYAADNDVLRDKSDNAGELAQAGRFDVARRLIEEARAHPAASSESIYAVDLAIHESVVLGETGQVEEALALAERALRERSGFGFTSAIDNYYLGLAYRGIGRLDDAVSTLKAYLEQSYPSIYHYAFIWTQLGQIYHQRGQYDEAEHAFDQALTLYPAFPEAHLALATLLQDQQRLDETRDHLDQALIAWSNADAGFAPAQAARQLRNALP